MLALSAASIVRLGFIGQPQPAGERPTCSVYQGSMRVGNVAAQVGREPCAIAADENGANACAASGHKDMTERRLPEGVGNGLGAAVSRDGGGR